MCAVCGVKHELSAADSVTKVYELVYRPMLSAQVKISYTAKNMDP